MSGIFDVWLSPGFLARSALFEWIWFQNREFWKGRKDGEVEALVLALVREFACGRCFDLAEAAGWSAGLPVMVIGGDRGDVGAIAHAAVFDGRRGLGMDVFGARDAAAMVSEMRALGRTDLKVGLKEAGPARADAVWEDIRAVRVASALPWMPSRYSRAERATIEDLVEVMASAQGDLREGV